MLASEEANALAQMTCDMRMIRKSSTMLSRLVSHVQFLSTELALKAIENQNPVTPQHLEPDASDVLQNPHTPLPVTTTDEPALSGARANLSLVVPSSGEAEADDTIVAFMETLKIWLADLSVDPTSFVQGNAMWRALGLGVLKVFDPIEGSVIVAWDPASARAPQIQSEKIDAVGWSEFLKQHVKRADGLSYAKDADGSYVDMMTGESAYFGAVGSKFRYFTWPRENTGA